MASLHQLPIYYYSRATTAEVGTNPTQKGLPPETDPAFIVERLANPNIHFNKFKCTCKLKCATLHWLHNNQNKNYTLKHITNYNKLHPRFLYLLALFVLPVCVCVCAGGNTCTLWGMGEPPFSHPQSTEFLLRLLQCPFTCCLPWNRTFVHIHNFPTETKMGIIIYNYRAHIIMAESCSSSFL